jgi:hypothetical protein
MGTAGSGGTKEASVQCALRWEAVGLGLSAPTWFMRLFISYARVAAALSCPIQGRWITVHYCSTL